MEKSKSQNGAASPFPKAGPSTERAAPRRIRTTWSTGVRSYRSVPTASAAGTRAMASPSWWTSCVVFSAARIGGRSRRPLRFARKFPSVASATASGISLARCKSTASLTANLSSARLTITSASFAPPNLRLAPAGPFCPATRNAKQKHYAAKMACRWFCRSSKSCATSPRKLASPSNKRNRQGWSTPERFNRLAANRRIQELNRVHHGSFLSAARQCGLHLQNTSGISCRHRIGFEWSNDLGFPISQLIGGIRLHQVEDSRRATADRSFRNFRKFKPGNARKQCARLQTNALRMLQVTRIVKSHAQFQPISWGARLEFGQHFADVSTLRREQLRPLCVIRIISEQVAVLLHVGPATCCIDHERLDVRALECINRSFR